MSKPFHTTQKVKNWDREAKVWLENWLTQRRGIFNKNARDAGMSPNYLELELTNMKRVPGVTANSVEDYAYWKKVYPNTPFRPLGYYPDGETLFYTPSLQRAGYSRYNTRRDIPMWDNNFVHENTHALVATPQMQAIRRIDPYMESNFLGEINFNSDADWRNAEYLSDPDEVYSRLNAARYTMKLKPTDIVDERTLAKHYKLLKELDLDQIPKKTLLKLFNEVAYEPVNNNNDVSYAKRGAKLVPRKFQLGGKFRY